MKNSVVRSFRRSPYVWATLLLALLAAISPATCPQAMAAPERIIAVGDVHGDFDAFVTILQQAGLIDAQHHWVGGNATLVQTGDLIDRGPKPREVLDLMMALEREAPKQGGRVVSILGNHELMNMMGDLRYVTPENFASFAEKDSESRRRAAYQAYLELRKARAGALKQPAPVPTPELEKAWMQTHPAGYVEQREAFAPTGTYGRWLREHFAIAQLGDTIFLHGGLSPQLASWKVDAIQRRVKNEIAAFDGFKKYLVDQKIVLPFFNLDELTAAAQAELDFRNAEAARKAEEASKAGRPAESTREEQQRMRYLSEFLAYGRWLSVNAEGPLWFRGFAQWPEEEGNAQVTRLLGALGAQHFVTGHTVQIDGRIHARFGGKVFLIDTGMLSAYYTGGRASELDIEDGKFTAVYRDERTVLLDRRSSRGGGLPSSQFEADPVTEVPGGGLEDPSQAPQAAANPAPAPASPPAFVWLGADGKPLPFKTEEELLEFLRTARITAHKGTSVGITHPEKVTLDKDGTQMHGVQRTFEEEKNIATLASGRTEMFFRDTYIFDLAAYELSRLLDLNLVPPVVLRKFEGHGGSMQAWLENTMTEGDRQKQKLTPPDPMRWNEQVQRMRVFDALIYNTDRNLGNILIDQQWKVWYIDHSRAFRRYDELLEQKNIQRCERHLFEKLRTLDEGVVKERLKPYLRSAEIDAVLKRRRKLVEYIQKLIDQHGEQEVLYSLDESPSPK